MVRIIGIDPGTAIVGWSILEEKDGQIESVAFGCITTDKKTPEANRLLEISNDLKEIIKKYSPAEAAIEKLFFFRNQTTIIEVGQARGVILLTLAEKNVRIHHYTPLQIKQAVTGYGRAKKGQIQCMTQKILCLKKLPTPDDAADALAVALCHLQSRTFLKKTHRLS